MHDTHGFVEDKMKKDEYGRIGFGPVSSSSSTSPCSAARAAASAALSKANSAALIGSLKCIKWDVNKTMSSKESFSCYVHSFQKETAIQMEEQESEHRWSLLWCLVLSPMKFGMFLNPHPTLTHSWWSVKKRYESFLQNYRWKLGINLFHWSITNNHQNHWR